MYLKFIYSEKATEFCEISTLLLTTVHRVKSKLEISQNFVAFSEYMNFKEFHATSAMYYCDESAKDCIKDFKSNCISFVHMDENVLMSRKNSLGHQK